MDNKRRQRRWEKTFLAKLRNTSNVRASCEAAKITRSEVYQYRDECPEFRALWDEAIEDACDVLEARAWKRSETSDTLLQFLLKAHRPGKYRETVKQEIEMQVSGGVTLYIPDNGRDKTE